MGPWRILDEALEKLCRGYRTGSASAGILYIGETRIDDLKGGAEEKIKIMESCGITIAKSPAEIGNTLLHKLLR